MKFKELSQLGHDERENKQKELELELIKLNTQVATGTPPKNAGMVRRIKKDIARIMFLKGNSQNNNKNQEKVLNTKQKMSSMGMKSTQKINKIKEMKQ
jgi:ribosomal protein L29